MRVLGYLVLFGFLGIVLLAGTVYVVHGISASADVRAAEQQAVADIEQALPGAQEESSRQRDAVLRQLDDDLGTATYSWQELTCGLSTHDAGWIVEDYVQTCSVRSVDLVAEPGTTASCRTVELPRPPDYPTDVSVVRGPSGALSDELAYPCPGGLTAPPASGASRLLSGDRPHDLDASPSWTVVETRVPVSETVLGCSPWGIVFCSSPVDEPLLGDDD